MTCAGHATVSTGAFPRTHGIVQNAWYNREAGRQVTCTEDSTVEAIGYGVRPQGGDSSHGLLLPTFADEMRTQRGSRVVTLSLKPRSAIMLAGRAGDAVTWLTPSLDGWQTSSAFSSAPVARRATVRECRADRVRLREDLDTSAPGFPVPWTPTQARVRSRQQDGRPRSRMS